MSGRVSVLFIGGYGRSGSTLLASVLGQLPGVCAVGELRHLWKRGLADNQLCGCGSPLRECAFWRQVLRSCASDLRTLSFGQVAALQQRVDRARHIPALARARLRSERFTTDLTAYGRVLTSIYRAVLTVSGAELVVDSSKDPSHGHLLTTLPNVRLRILHLVRDSRAVAFSWQRRRIRPEIHWTRAHMPRLEPRKAALEWSFYNLATEALNGGDRPYACVRYEDLASDPANVLARISGRLLSGREIPLQGREVELATTHSVSGNPMRFQSGRVTIRPDREWRDALDAGQRRLVTALTWPLLLRYGYAVGR